MLKQWLLGSALFFISTYASAQCGGMVNVNGVCIPPDQASSPLHGQYTYGQPGQTSPVTPSPIVMQQKWADRWGAIATDEIKPIMGASTGKKNKKLAQADALAKCREQGGKKCSLLLTYHNQCAAMLAKERGGVVAAGSPTIDGAVDYGMQICKKDGVNCRVYYTNCSMSESYWVRQ